jgi:outer membrane protein assembly factor BamB
MNILTPVVHDDAVFTSSYGGGSFLFEVGQSGTEWSAREAWSSSREAYMSTPVVIDGFACLHLRNQRFACIDLSTGEERWVTTPYGAYWSMVANGENILALDERGELYLIDANPDEFTLIDSRKASDESTWAPIAVAGEDVVIRELNGVVSFRWMVE